ncbi:CLUMA_CG002800, isoform A [Clunio marinus]|uniref:CLUMA_CG002800, isoform A n=1 Tax=Clunio marinus TaxID=568069 RepID=A0A1J1HLU0_9DIPT|nr:CLUMA_CG002800, isoform A [Clunio marinus]
MTVESRAMPPKAKASFQYNNKIDKLTSFESLDFSFNEKNFELHPTFVTLTSTCSSLKPRISSWEMRSGFDNLIQLQETISFRSRFSQLLVVLLTSITVEYRYSLN